MMATPQLVTTAFDQLKRESLRKLRVVEDKSPKGSVDAPIVGLIRMINDLPHYVTSSSCSGRIAVFCGVSADTVDTATNAMNVDADSSVAAFTTAETADPIPPRPTANERAIITKGGTWLLAEHGTISLAQLREALTRQQAMEFTATGNSGMVLFKHEPFIMHTVCRDIAAAKEMLQCGIACGFRESGIVVGNKKIMCAIRTTANAMEIPLGRMPHELLVNEAYLQWIVDIANAKFEVNRKKTDALFAALRTRLATVPVSMSTSLTDSNQSLQENKTGKKQKKEKKKTSAVTLRGCRELRLVAGGDEKDMPLQRTGHTTVLYAEALYVFGGQGPTASGTSSRLADLIKLTRQSHNEHGTKAEEERGGSKNSASAFISTLVGTNENKGDDTAPPSARMHHTAVVVRDRMIVFGGRAGPTKCFNDIHMFDLRTETWSKSVTVMDGTHGPPAARWKHSCSVVGDVMYIHGGRDATTVFDDLFALDLAQTQLEWRKIDTNSPVPRFDHIGVTVTTSNARLLFWGGMSSVDDPSGCDHATCTTFDTKTETWATEKIRNITLGPPPGLIAASAAVVDKIHVAVCGGTSTASVPHQQQRIYLLNSTTMEWRMLGIAEIAPEADATGRGDSDTPISTVSMVDSTCSWLAVRSELVILGGGFQCFGFGQVYSSCVTCELVVVQKTSAALSHAAAADLSASSKVIGTTTKAPVDTAPMIRSAPEELPSSVVSERNEQVRDASQPWGVLVEKTQVKQIKTLLEQAGVYDKSRRVRIAPEHTAANEDNVFLIPVTADIDTVIHARGIHSTPVLTVVPDGDAYANKYGKALGGGCTRNDVIQRTIRSFATRYNLPDTALTEIPDKYEIVGDVLLVPRESFLESSPWGACVQEMWAAVCAATTPRLTRVARKAFIDTSERRQSHMELLFVDTHALHTDAVKRRVFPDQDPSAHPGWVQVRENGITYSWDITKVMFSSGNVTEKARVARLPCRGEVIVDLFAGIGYYVVPYLVHAGASMVHACEWNPDSVVALRANLARNHVAHKCVVYEGDNQLSAPQIGAVADRVNLGLLPTSEKAWPLAVLVLKPTGGWMHVHDNVAVEDRARWEAHVVESIRVLAEAVGKRWVVSCEHVERVKSYAPKVHHLVADIRCVPMSHV